jgi:hypothetical protein
VGRAAHPGVESWHPERPHLTSRPDGTIVLAEGTRKRVVAADAARALASLLGDPRPDRDEHDTPLPRSSCEVRYEARPDLAALLEQAPPGATVVLVGEDEAARAHRGRVVQPLRAETGRHGGADPDRGDGPLDHLMVRWARGATHLLVGDSAWLRHNVRAADHLARVGTVVACSPSGVLWELAARPAAGAPKIFVIGLPKTGTTSLHRAFETLGLRSFHWGGARAYHAVLRAEREGGRLLARVGESYDAYSDVETLSVRFDLADLQYPGSRFIFTVRDIEDWVASNRRHAERNQRSREDGTYNGANVEIDEARWRSHWATHVRRVDTWFRGRTDLLTLDICSGEGWEKLAPFLDRPVPPIPFPQENVDGITSRASSWWRRRTTD